MPLNEKQEKLIIYIDRKVNKMSEKNKSDINILASLADVMSELKSIINSPDKNVLDKYTQKYPGFYRFMKILETLARGISNGSISVP